MLDRAYLSVICERFDGGPVGIEAIAASLSEERGTLEEVVEPFLLQVGFIARTPRGRVATAAGCQLVAMCDLAVAAEGARFAVSGVNVGLFCATPSVPLSRNVGRKAAFEMLVTGEFIDARAAVQRGLVNRCVPADRLDQETDELAASIVAKPPSVVAAGKALFYRQLELGIPAAYALAGIAMARNMSDDVAQEGVAAFIEKRAPSWSIDS